MIVAPLVQNCLVPSFPKPPVLKNNISRSRVKEQNNNFKESQTSKPRPQTQKSKNTSKAHIKQWDYILSVKEFQIIYPLSLNSTWDSPTQPHVRAQKFSLFAWDRFPTVKRRNAVHNWTPALPTPDTHTQDTRNSVITQHLNNSSRFIICSVTKLLHYRTNAWSWLRLTVIIPWICYHCKLTAVTHKNTPCILTAWLCNKDFPPADL